MKRCRNPRLGLLSLRIVGRRFGNSQTMLLCRRLRRWHCLSFPSRKTCTARSSRIHRFATRSSIERGMSLCRIASLSPSSSTGSRARLDALSVPVGAFLSLTRSCPWYHCFIFMLLGSVPEFLGASVSFSPHRAPSRCCLELMRGAS